MTKLTRFFAISLLVLSMSAVIMADGGETQGPGSPEPPPPGETQGPGAPSCSTLTSENTVLSEADIIIQSSEELACWVLNVL